MFELALELHRGGIEWGTVADWAMVVVTIVAAMATVAAVGVAVWTAISASHTARETERARVAEVQARAVSAYSERLNQALVSLFQTIGSHLLPVRNWLGVADQLEQTGRALNVFGEEEYPPAPPLDAVLAEAEAVRLVARSSDAAVARGLAHALAATANLPPYKQAVDLRALMAATREWRSGERDAASTVAYFAEYEKQHHS